MAIDRKQLLKIFEDRCEEKEQLVPEYNAELKNAVAEIVLRESENQERRTDIQKQVNDICGRLGKYVIMHKK